MIPDVLINGQSMFMMGWLRENIDFPTPKSQSEIVIVPGRNSPIRFTESLGRVSFEPRTFSIVLSMLGTRAKYNELVKECSNKFSGRLAKVICTEEPSLYSFGTLELKPAYDPLTGRGELLIECVDADSYRYHVDITEVTITGNGTVTLLNDYMPVVPTVITTAEILLSWKIGTDSFKKTLSSGTWELPELQLSHGENTVNVTGTGTTTFKYREGCL